MMMKLSVPSWICSREADAVQQHNSEEVPKPLKDTAQLQHQSTGFINR
jgi:hypothetical protein